MSRTAGLVLAAGAGRRYGSPKALVRLGDRLLVERAADLLAAGGCDPVLVVLGAAADEVLATAALPETVLNPDWATGMGSSLRAGLAALPPRRTRSSSRWSTRRASAPSPYGG